MPHKSLESNLTNSELVHASADDNSIDLPSRQSEQFVFLPRVVKQK
ncbi:MAG: hypothetical protein HC775_01705 [Hyellaceae cyanobacterium CSU_1_1]|nr:hypothetical protein [Hyellaceae cyanobacterium CSU_1_1]